MVEAVDGGVPGGRAVAAGGQRGGAGGQLGPPRRRGAGRAAGVRHVRPPATCARSSSTTRARAGCAWRRRWTISWRAPTGPAPTPRPSPTTRGSSSPPTWRPGKPLRIVKLFTYGWSAQRSVSALRDQVSAAGHGAVHAGWDGLCKAQRAYMDEFWERSDVEIEGDAELQQAIRFGLFHTLQAGARGRAAGDRRQGADRPRLRRAHVLGHRDVRPAGAHLHRPACLRRRAALAPADDRPGARSRQDARARRALRSRGGRSTARSARATGRRGPRRSTSTPTSPSAVCRYQAATGDSDFEQTVGTELLVETARLWRSLGHHDAAGRFRIDGVTGPDEYSAVADNNVYTNLMAQRNLTRRRRRGRTPPAPRRRAGGRRGGDGELARRRRQDGHPLRRGARGPPPVRAVHRPSALGLRGLHGGAVPAAAPLPLLRPVPQAGGQAGRPGAGPVHVRRRVHRRGEGPRLRVLRGAHRPRLVAVGVLPGGGRRRGGPPRARLRLLRRGGADGPRRPGAQHPRRHPHRLGGGHLDRRRRAGSAGCATTAAS